MCFDFYRYINKYFAKKLKSDKNATKKPCFYGIFLNSTIRLLTNLCTISTKFATKALLINKYL